MFGLVLDTRPTARNTRHTWGKAHWVSDGKGGQQAHTEDCHFITEFIAPGGGHGQRGAGIRLLDDLWKEAGGSAAGEVHGYVWSGNTRAREWWGRRGLTTI